MQSTFKSIIEQARNLETAIARQEKEGIQKRRKEQKDETAARAKEEAKKTATTVKEEQKRARETEKAQRNFERGQERYFARLARYAENARRKEELEEKRSNQRREAEAKRTAAAREHFTNRFGGKLAGSIGRTIGFAGSVAAGITALGGGFGVVDATQDAVQNSAKARTIALNAGGDKDAILSQAKGIATSEGFKTSEVLGGLDAFISKTGRLDKASEVMGRLAKLANATGASFEDLSQAAGLAFNADKLQSAEDLMLTMRVIAAQGEKGALDIRELAKSLPRITATAQHFKGDRQTNTAYLGALAQLSMQAGTATTADEATMSVSSLAKDIGGNAKEFKALGINPFDKDNKLIDPSTTIEKAIVATQGNSGQLQKLFGARSFRAIEGINNTYVNTRSKALAEGKSNKEASQLGVDAFRNQIKEFTDAVLTAEQVERRSAERKQEADKKLTAVFERLKIAVGEKVLPKFEQLLPVLEKWVDKVPGFIESFTKAAEWVTENPLKAALVGLGALVTKSVAEAFAPQIISAALSSAVGVAGLAIVASMATIEVARQMDMADKKKDGDLGKTEFEKDEEETQRLKARVAKYQNDANAGRGDIYLQGAKEELIAHEAKVKEKRDKYFAQSKSFKDNSDDTWETVGNLFGIYSGGKPGEVESQQDDRKIQGYLDAIAEKSASDERTAETMKNAAENFQRAAAMLKDMKLPPPPPNMSSAPPRTDGHN